MPKTRHRAQICPRGICRQVFLSFFWEEAENFVRYRCPFSAPEACQLVIPISAIDIPRSIIIET